MMVEPSLYVFVWQPPYTISVIVGHNSVSFDEWYKLTFPKIGGDIDNLRWFFVNNLGHESVLSLYLKINGDLMSRVILDVGTI